MAMRFGRLDLNLLVALDALLTARAEELIEPVRAVLEQVRTTIAIAPPFDPATIDRQIRIMASDHTTQVLLAAAIALVEREVPRMRFEIQPMHRTNSIDYGIVVEGEIELELDGRDRKTIGQGGIIVQRGTNHLWRNTTDKPCRIVFVLIEASAYRHNGAALAEAKPEQVTPR